VRIRRLVSEEFDRVGQSFRTVALKQTGIKRTETEEILTILEEKRDEVMNRPEAGYFIHDWNEISDQVRKMIGQDSRFKLIKSSRLARLANKSGKRKQMNIRPLYDRLVVKRSDEVETSRNGIIIPDSAKEKPQEGTVIAVGRGKRLEDGTLVPLDVKAGDRILFGKYSGSETKLDGTEYIIIREDDVLGILDATAQSEKAA
jgi:chaperonin GroES